MYSASATVHIGRGVEEVFDAVVNFDRMSEWVEGLHSISQDDDGPVGVGTAFSAKLDFRGKTQPFNFVITAWQRPYIFGLKAYRGPLPFETVVTLRGVDDSTTEVEKTLVSAGGLAARLFTKALTPFLTRAVRREVDALQGMLGGPVDRGDVS